MSTKLLAAATPGSPKVEIATDLTREEALELIEKMHEEGDLRDPGNLDLDEQIKRGIWPIGFAPIFVNENGEEEWF